MPWMILLIESFRVGRRSLEFWVLHFGETVSAAYIKGFPLQLV